MPHFHSMPVCTCCALLARIPFHRQTFPCRPADPPLSADVQMLAARCPPLRRTQQDSTVSRIGIVNTQSFPLIEKTIGEVIHNSPGQRRTRDLCGAFDEHTWYT